MKKYRRKNYLINKPLQLRYTVFITAIVMVYSGFIIYTVKMALDSSLKAVCGSSMDPEQMLAFQLQNGNFFIATVVLLVLNALIVAGLWLVVMHRIAGPLYRLNRSIGEVKAGRLPPDIHLRKGDELSDLISNFNEMVSTLRDAAHRDADALKPLLEQTNLLQAGFKGAQSIGAAELQQEIDSLAARLRAIRDMKAGAQTA